MNIQKINFLTSTNYNNKPQKTAQNNSQNVISQYNYNPIVYRDFNINFGDRLFRSPENFFEQDFNRENMPDTMKDYLFENYEDRQHIPPAQMMKIIFNDINYAKTLEEVKDLYPDEELFANLHSMSNKKYREGILAEINLMREPNKTLFKNGKDDLGMYILKKIYLESKTLKEINLDFKKDVSVHYAGLSDIKYADLANFGIKFPKQSFWHSLYATREDFPFVSLKRADSEYHAGGKGKPSSIADIRNLGDSNKYKPKFNPNEGEVKRMTDAIINGAGSRNRTQRELKNKLGSSNPQLQFIQKYFGEIMSITLERVHASEDMRDFFENYEEDDSTKSKNKMQQYWNTTPEMKALMGLIMSDTIKLFFLAYGADGNNEYFQDLLDYAHSIKPEREARKQRHNELQDEYEMALGIFEDPEEDDDDDISDDMIREFEKLKAEIKKGMEDLKKIENAHPYQLGDITINLFGSIENLTEGYCNERLHEMLPKQYINKYVKFLQESPEADTKFLLSMILYDSKNTVNDEVMKRLYTPEETADKIYDLQCQFMKNNMKETRAVHQAIITAVANRFGVNDDKSELLILYSLYPMQIASSPNMIIMDKTGLSDEITKYYDIYKQPISNTEANKATIVAADILRNYDVSKSHLVKVDIAKDEVNKMKNISKFYKNSKNMGQDYFKRKLMQYIVGVYGGSARALLDPTMTKELRAALVEDIILSMITKYPKMYENMEFMYIMENSHN